RSKWLRLRYVGTDGKADRTLRAGISRSGPCTPRKQLLRDGTQKFQPCGWRHQWRSRKSASTARAPDLQRDPLSHADSRIISVLGFDSPWRRCAWDVRLSRSRGGTARLFQYSSYSYSRLRKL